MQNSYSFIQKFISHQNSNSSTLLWSVLLSVKREYFYESFSSGLTEREKPSQRSIADRKATQVDKSSWCFSPCSSALTEGDESSQRSTADWKRTEIKEFEGFLPDSWSLGLTEWNKSGQRGFTDWEIVQESWGSLSSSGSRGLTEWQQSPQRSAADWQRAEVDKSWRLCGWHRYRAGSSESSSNQ